VQQGAAQLKEQTFLNSVIARLSWLHHIILMDKVADQGKCLWYMLFVLEHGVIRNVLAIQIEGGLFEGQVAGI
jgi:predicted nuclease of restriction endonuclease-like (RecB) superfamily